MGRYSARIHRKPRGFTLIELLVVIAIIGLLSSIVLAAVNIARGKAYDSERFTDLREVQTALENYYADNGKYPMMTSGASYSACKSGGGVNQEPQNSVIPNIVPNYISTIPEGPEMQINNSNHYDCYIYKSDGTDYKFYDLAPDYATPLPGATPSGALKDPGGRDAWAVYSPGYANL